MVLECGVRIVSEPMDVRSLGDRDAVANTIVFLLLLIESFFLLACLLYV